AQGVGAGTERAIDLACRLDVGLEVLAAYTCLRADARRNDVHDVAAMRDDRVDANRVLVPEGLAQVLDRAQRERGRVEGVDALLGGRAGVRSLTDEADV